MNVRSPTAQTSDLNARARIREAALALFGSEGFAVPLRTIADAAGVSAGLVIHHFRSKEGLREAVDESVMAAFRDRFASLPQNAPADELSRAMGAAFADVITTSPEIRQYLRRSVLDGTPASSTVLDELLASIRRGLDRLQQAGGLRDDSDPVWRPFQVLFVVLGPLLLEPVLQRHLGEPVYAPDVTRARTAANYDFVSRGLFRGTAGSEQP
jgi:TetR/AcrR family transcriptional regulator, regulator of cefoperazone and chloramphenicol sensitivity